MASIAEGLAGECGSPLAASEEAAAVGGEAWSLLNRLESTGIGRRLPDGSIRVRRREEGGCFLYGPYLHLPAGSYRLSFRCEPGQPLMTAQPVLGVEVLVSVRFQLGWADFTAAELASGSGSLSFEVPPELGVESGNAERFEFRFFHFGNAQLGISAVELEHLPRQALPAAAPRQWRLLGRLSKTWLGSRRHDGSVRFLRRRQAGYLLYGGWPYLRLPCGEYRVILRCRCRALRRPGQSVIGIEVFADSRWNSGGRWHHLARLPQSSGIRLARQNFTADAIQDGAVSVDFTVPTDLAIESAADAPLDLRIRHFGSAVLDIEAVDLFKIDDDKLPSPVSAPQRRFSGRGRIVILGNCQAETLRQGFLDNEVLNRRFDARYHFVELSKKLYEFAARDLERCDILLVQDIRLCEAFPLRDRLRPGAETIKFPALRLASPWPFDSWNGPGDREAHDREAPNLTFPYLDGLLGRLRKEIPDKEQRLQVYRSLEWPGIVNYRRLHQTELRRLANMDKQFGISIGAFIVDNFQKRRIFHTTARPNWQTFGLLMQGIAKWLGVTDPVSLAESSDVLLRNPQIPVHPKVARDLGIVWANENTRYLNHGRGMVWEEYVRSYMDHYG
jgi:hypothetical protein